MVTLAPCISSQVALSEYEVDMFWQESIKGKPGSWQVKWCSLYPHPSPEYMQLWMGLLMTICGVTRVWHSVQPLLLFADAQKAKENPARVNFFLKSLLVTMHTTQRGSCSHYTPGSTENSLKEKQVSGSILWHMQSPETQKWIQKGSSGLLRT